MDRLLIVVDMQNDFITGCLGTEQAQQIVSQVIKKVEEFQGDVWFTMDTHTEEYLSTQEGRNLPVTHCVENTNGWKLADGLAKLQQQRNAPVFKKGAFGSVSLAKEVKQRFEQGELKEVVLCGVCTDICVISNAILLKSFVPELLVRVDANCCAGVTVESHQNALEAMKMCQVMIDE